jgi:hypothetical protein
MAVASTTTQATLKANIDGYMHRTFTAGELSQFVDSASFRIGRDLRSTAQLKTGSLRPVAGIADLPARCVEIRSIRRTDGTQLQSWGFNAGQIGTATGSEILYRPVGQGPSGLKRVELWPRNTEGTATVSVTSLSSVTTLATCVATAHGYATGAFVEFAGHGEAEYNDTFGPITKVDADTFTFAVDADFVDASSGTITARLVTLLIDYFEGPDPAFTLGDANPVLEAHPEIYLYAALSEAAQYVRDIDSFSQYAGLYQAEVARVNAETRNLAWGAFPAAVTNVNMGGRPASAL